MDANKIYNLIMGEYNNSTPYKDYMSAAIGGINRQTQKRANEMQSKYATTGMGRTGTSGAALSDIYSTGGESITSAAAQGATMQAQSRQNLINQLLGLYQTESANEAQSSDWGDVLGSMAGLFGGATLGKLGSRLGSSLFKKSSG
jgi:hypothetical protein